MNTPGQWLAIYDFLGGDYDRKERFIPIIQAIQDDALVEWKSAFPGKTPQDVAMWVACAMETAAAHSGMDDAAAKEIYRLKAFADSEKEK